VVEFALILPIFLLVTLGVVDAARLFTANIALTNGVREAAIYVADGSNFTKWCHNPNGSGKAPSPPVSVPCPAGATSSNYSPDPDNIAYRIAAEATGIDASRIVLSPPACNPSPCGATSTTVTITAQYDFRFLTPIIGAVLGNQVRITASTTASILQ
jgi:hypothetical protein